MTDPLNPQPDPTTPPPAMTPPHDAAAVAAAPTKEEKTWAMAAHLTALIAIIGIPFANVIAPLIVWLVKKDTMPFVDDQGKESLNFQITVMIPIVILGVLTFIPFVFCVTIPAMLVIGLAALIFTIIGGIKANEGQAYRYPVNIRFIK